MKFGPLRRIAALAGAASLIALIADPALAQAPATPPAPTPNKGDTAWMLTATALVLLMTVPGLALFYGGLVRTKNMLSMLMQVFFAECIVIILWVLYGYSLAFSEGGSFNAFVGGFSKAFLAGVTPDSNVETFTDGVVIPELAYVCFQMTFAAITCALVVGSMAERMKFSAIALFVPLWATFVYFPIAHMVWYWAGPAATVAAHKALAAAGGDAKAAAQTALDTVSVQRRACLPVGRARLRRRHGCAHQRRHRRIDGGAHHRQAGGLRPRIHGPAFADHDHGRRSIAVGRLVRLQRGLRARGQRHRRIGDDQHLRGDRGRSAGLVARGEHDQG